MALPTLRPYQARAVEAAREAFGEGVRRILIVAPTGAGKGTIAAFLLASAAGRGRRAAFAVHRAELVRDIARRAEAAGCARVAVAMGAESRPDPEALVTVGTVQTFSARDWSDPAADLLVIDEAHHATASTYRALADRHPRAVTLGLTATPQRADRTALGDAFDRLIVAASVRELTEAGHLVPARIIAPGGRRKRHDRSLAAYPLDAYREHAAGRRTIVFCASISHAEDTCAAFVGAGVRAAVVHSELSTDDRRARLEAFASHALDVLLNVGILTEGYDDPSVAAVIVARSVGSPGAWLQIVGRALRPAPEKTDALIVDLGGSVFEHGHPADAREWSLAGKPIRLAEDEDAEIRQCPECGSVFRANAFRDARCPHCAHVSLGRDDPRVIRERLEEIRAAELARLTAQRHLDFLSAEVERAIARGRKPTSAIFAFKATFHRYPTRAEREHAGIP